MRDKIRGIATYFVSWLFSALVLILVSAALINLCDISMQSIGFFSSAITFISALVAGTTIRGKLFTSIFTGAIFSIVLILTGWLIKGSINEMCGIVSVIPFTITGTVFGSMMSAGRNKKVNSVNIKNKIKIK